MDLRSVSNPTVASQNNQLDSSVSRQLLIDAPRPARAASLSSTKVEPGFGDMLKMEPDLARRIESNDGPSTEPSQLEEKIYGVCWANSLWQHARVHEKNTR